MSCSFQNCHIIVDTERSLSCWICSDIWHIKCAGISARVADEIYSKQNGLKWCCVKCRQISIEFCRFLKEASSEIKEMGRELWSLYSRFGKFSSLFEKFPDLEDFMSSAQKRKRETNKTSTKTDFVTPKSVETAKLDDRPTSSRFSPVIKDGDRQKRVTFASPSVNSKQDKNPKPVSKSCQKDDTQDCESVTQISQGKVPCVNNETVNLSPIADNRAKRPKLITKTLSSATAKKIVFVSRLAPDTTTDEVNSYIRSCIKGDFYLKTFKLRSSYADHRSSFKVIIPPDIFDKIVKREFWPKRAFVKEFVDRDDHLAHLPSLQATSKN